MNQNDKTYHMDMSGANYDREMYWDNYGEVEDCPICSDFYQMGGAVALYQTGEGISLFAHEVYGRELFSACSEECCYAMAAASGIRADEIQGM